MARWRKRKVKKRAAEKKKNFCRSKRNFLRRAQPTHASGATVVEGFYAIKCSLRVSFHLFCFSGVNVEIGWDHDDDVTHIECRWWWWRKKEL